MINRIEFLFIILEIFHFLFFVFNENLMFADEFNKSSPPKNVNIIQDNPKNRNVICGPKCIGFILDYYGITDHPNIIVLMQELQGQNIYQGTTIMELSKYLNQKGIYTTPIGISNMADIHWEYPVLVHYKPLSPNELGHFVVWLPSSKRTMVRCWDGDRGEVDIPISEWHKLRSGSILLTSPVKIDRPEKSIIYSGLEADSIYTKGIGAIVLLIGLAICWIAYSPYRRLRSVKN
jgi:ABC-type bacteriocin/lantibiotic exporter with double-glycine peptidase domain